MKMPFHKSCYTSRCSGYKYRTLSTSTGPDGKRSRRPSAQREESLINQKFYNLQDNISFLIGKEIDDTKNSRKAIYEKFEKIDAKINSLIELQDNVLSLRQTLYAAENTLEDLFRRVQKYEVMNEINSVKFKKSQRAKRVLAEEETEQEIYSSDIVAPTVLAL